MVSAPLNIFMCLESTQYEILYHPATIFAKMFEKISELVKVKLQNILK